MSLRPGVRRRSHRAATPVDALALVRRFDGLHRFLAAAATSVPAERLAAATNLLQIAGGRLALSGGHTLVALAGATGTGKSSLFNVLAGYEWSAVGLRRPTTGTAHACVWGGGGTALLDWLGVPSDRRLSLTLSPDPGSPAPAGGDQPDRGVRVPGGAATDLRGLVLVDLPDLDSVLTGHRAEVDRLLPLVDLVVWVVDPQKYADHLLHERYLRTFAAARGATVVVLNQADRLGAADTGRCVADLTRLLAEEGLDGVPVLAASASGRPGTGAVRAALAGAVAARHSALRRLSGELDAALDDLSPLVAATIAEHSQIGQAQLVEALCEIAGVPALVDATARAYRRQAVARVGWPVTRWLSRMLTHPLRPREATAEPAMAGSGGQAGSPVGSSGPAGRPGAGPGVGPGTVPGVGLGTVPGIGPGIAHGIETVAEGSGAMPLVTPARMSAVAHAVRPVTDRATADMPAPWHPAVSIAARSGLDRLPYALDAAVAGTVLPAEHRRRWWQPLAVLQWLATAATLAGAAWWLVRLSAAALGVPDMTTPRVRGFALATVLVVAGAATGLLIAMLARPAIAIGARRAGGGARDQLRAAVTVVATTHVLAPVRRVRQRYVEAREALAAAYD